MKRLILFLTVLVFAVNIGHTAEKRILMEQFTGSWCGWCVDGTYIMDSLIKKYPNNVIPVKQHISDGMSTEQTQYLYDAFGAGGVPSAAINRLDFTGVTGAYTPYLIDRGYWFGFVQNLLKETPTSDVSCSWYYDETVQQIKGLITSSLLKDLPFQQTLNAIITEDKVTGTGSGFDQNNYYSGLKGAENHPYYKKPPVLYNYEHNYVSRYLVGGAWGEKLNIKKPGYIGESYQWSFCVEVPKPITGNPVNINNLNIIGVSSIDDSNKSDILNCVKGTKEIPKTTFLYSTNGYTHYINDKLTINMKIDNFTEIDNDYEVVIENQGYGANNWQINVEKNIFAIKSGESISFKIDVIPNSQGMKKFKVILKDKDNKIFNAFSNFTIYNTNTEKFVLMLSTNPLFLNMGELAVAGYDDFIQLNLYDADLRKLFPNSKLFLFDNADNSALSVFSSQLIDTLTQEGKKLFVIGNGIAAMTKTYPALMTFWAKMGFKFNEQYTKFDDVTAETLGITGYKGDPVSNASKMTLVPTEVNKEYSTFGIIDYEKARPVFSITKDPNSIIAFRSLLNNQRVLFSAFNFFNINDEEKRMDYINKSIDWLMDGLGEEQPHLSASNKELNFKLVELGKSDTMDVVIKNNGTSPLIINSQNVLSATGEYFALKPTAYKSINASDSIVYQIRYTPVTKNQSKGTFEIKSNDPYRDSIAISLTGKGRTSVEDNLTVGSYITVSPNPINNSGQITVLFDNNMQNINIKLVDIEGRIIKTITNGDFPKGKYTFNLSTNDLNSGSYFIQLTNEVNTICQPIIIEK